MDTQGEGHVRRPGEWLDSSTRGFKFGAASGKGGGVGGGGGDEGTQGSELIGRGGDGFGREEILTKAAKTLPGRHVQLFRDLQAKWQCYDAYARVCMSIGSQCPKPAQRAKQVGAAGLFGRTEENAVSCSIWDTWAISISARRPSMFCPTQLAAED